MSSSPFTRVQVPTPKGPARSKTEEERRKRKKIKKGEKRRENTANKGGREGQVKGLD
jgi:hypothetical protein